MRQHSGAHSDNAALTASAASTLTIPAARRRPADGRQRGTDSPDEGPAGARPDSSSVESPPI
ncbi:hypothetical protein VR44_19525 [Streptomyces katrae]|uniref:Uncharacterized protein n=1 Tax=Streptomyces katrae TaxID=68223 RepID=A0A0F4J8S4_9ACTN|nr:hypothetical protein VR44_19525 [Streptomyces katrae]